MIRNRLGHDAAHPRGFTLLCQRVGRALADAAEVRVMTITFAGLATIALAKIGAS